MAKILLTILPTVSASKEQLILHFNLPPQVVVAVIQFEYLLLSSPQFQPDDARQSEVQFSKAVANDPREEESTDRSRQVSRAMRLCSFLGIVVIVENIMGVNAGGE